MFNKWIKPGNKDSVKDIYLIINSLNETSFPDSTGFTPNPLSGTTCYWNGSEWVFEENSNSISTPGLIFSAGQNGSITMGAPLNQQVNEYDVFTKEGWIHVKSRLPYIPSADKLYYDEENNRFILLKGNEPWIYNLD